MRYALFAVGIVVLGGVWFAGQQSSESIESTTPTAVINGHVLQLEVVRTPEEQARGLSGREKLAENSGMLFVFEESLVPSFWMKDMNFPIDIIWIGSDKRIVDISANIAPETFPQLFHPRAPVQYVLEVNAGWAQNHNLSLGGEITLDLSQ